MHAESRGGVAAMSMGESSRAEHERSSVVESEGRRDLLRRVLFTLAAVAIYLFATRVTLPGVNAVALPDGADSSALRVGALGASDVVPGALLVELAAWLVGRSAERRSQIRSRWTRRVVLVLACIHSVGVTLWVMELSELTGLELVVTQGLGGALLVWLTLVASVALMLLWLEALTRFGLGNGFAVFTLIEFAQAIVRACVRGELPVALVSVAFIGAAAALAWLAIRNPVVELDAPDGGEGELPASPALRVPPSGVVSLGVGTFALTCGASTNVAMVVVALSALGLGRFWHLSITPSARAHLRSAALLVAAFLLVECSVRGAPERELWPTAVMTLLAVAALADLIAEARARASLGVLAVVAEKHGVGG